MFTSYVKNKDF
jgi:transposase InsO family protein